MHLWVCTPGTWRSPVVILPDMICVLMHCLKSLIELRRLAWIYRIRVSPKKCRYLLAVFQTAWVIWNNNHLGKGVLQIKMYWSHILEDHLHGFFFLSKPPPLPYSNYPTPHPNSTLPTPHPNSTLLTLHPSSTLPTPSQLHSSHSIPAPLFPLHPSSIHPTPPNSTLPTLTLPPLPPPPTCTRTTQCVSESIVFEHFWSTYTM